LVKGLNIAIKPEVKSSSQDPATPQKKTRIASMFGSFPSSKKRKLGDDKTAESIEETTAQVLSYYYSIDSM
jgi:hypothetical protein